MLQSIPATTSRPATPRRRGPHAGYVGGGYASVPRRGHHAVQPRFRVT